MLFRNSKLLIKAVVIISVILAAATACKRETPESCCKEGSDSVQCKPPEKRTGQVSGISETSVYNLESVWTNQDEKDVQLSELQGKIQIVAMIYTRCKYACPRIIADLKRIETEVGSMEDVYFTLITMDPENDTPSRLNAFAKENKLDLQKWTLLTGKEADIIDLAAVLNVRFNPEPDGEISHSNIITVLNRSGEVVSKQEGLGTDPTETIHAVKKLVQNL